VSFRSARRDRPGGRSAVVSPRIADLAGLMLLEIMTFPELLERQPRQAKRRARR